MHLLVELQMTEMHSTGVKMSKDLVQLLRNYLYVTFSIIERMLLVMKCLKFEMQDFLPFIYTGFTFNEISPSTFLHPLLFKFLLHCSSFYIFKSTVKTAKHLSFLIPYYH